MKEQSAADVHRRAFVFDAHSDDFNHVAWRRSIGERQVLQRYHLPELRAGGVDGLIANIVIEPVFRPYQALPRAVQILGAALEDLTEAPDFRVVREGRDFARATETGQIAMIIGLEGGEPVEYSVESLRVFWELGIRSIILAWMNRNLLAEGTLDGISGGGLSLMGEQIVREANRLGVVIDVSHLPPTAVMHVLRVSERPVIASHTNAAAVFPNPRNLSDETLLAIAAAGGVIGVQAARPSLSADDASIDDVVRHIEHLVNLVGERHVGLGLDLNQFMRSPESGSVGEVFNKGGKHRPVRGCSEWRHLPDLTAHLMKRGHNETTVSAILGGNFLRFYEDALGSSTT